jgi:hypothetical protein
MALNDEPLLAGESPLHCGSVYHLVRVTGLGSDYVLPLYELSMRVGEKSGRFFPRMTALASYLNCHPNQLYNAARLLVKCGFWVRLTNVRGKAVDYRPLSHKDWVVEHGKTGCCVKAEMPWDDEEQDPLGKALYGVTGGANFYPNVLKGWRNKSGLTDAQIIDRAKQFMGTPDATMKSVDPQRVVDPKKFFSHKKDPAFRKRLGAFICKEA